MGDGILVPGEILVMNVNIGVDPQDSKYQILKNLNSDQTIKCLKDKHGVHDVIYRVSENLWIPVLGDPNGEFAIMLAPSLMYQIGLEMGVSDIVCSDERYIFCKYNKMFLGGSQKFHSPREQYELMVHLEDDISYKNKVCQAVVSGLFKYKYPNGSLQTYRHVDADFLMYCGEELVKKNSESLDFILDHEGETWWDLAGQKCIQQKLESITEIKRKPKAYGNPETRSFSH